MPAEHLRQLIARVAPQRSVRQLTEAAGVPQGRLAYWLRPTTVVTRVPPWPTLSDIAQVIGCEVAQVYHAFAADAGVDIDDDLTDDEHALLRAYRSLDDADRRKLHAIIEVLQAG
ncbi:MAG: hypothetical protein ACRDRZ_05460 [Pseudonocardiaceae bacterium]